ncbi:hypothetical protein QJQ45_024024 [Haematococcus lacustris]|nr:hypothetical protein QJQ45_024024 [Haematococcus lacustris]
MLGTGLTNPSSRVQLARAGGSARPVGGLARCHAKRGEDVDDVSYGNDWYAKTRARPRTVREEIEYRRAANLAANNGKERKDLYTDNWDGSEYKGSVWNVGTLVLALFFLVPALGLAFAYWSYGTLWG